jgi:Spy/CpxP family protein refolding chaperone
MEDPMKTINQRIAVLSLAAVVLAGTSFAYAGPRAFGGCDRGGPGNRGTAVQQLDNLTPDQQIAIRQIRDEAREASRVLRTEMRDTRGELRAVMAQGGGPEAVRDLAEKRGDQKAGMILLRAETHEKINRVLNEQQREQLAELRAARQQSRGYSPQAMRNAW